MQPLENGGMVTRGAPNLSIDILNSCPLPGNDFFSPCSDDDKGGRGRKRLISTRTVLGFCNYASGYKGATSEMIDAPRVGMVRVRWRG